jgi:hypothetical protein
MYPFGFAIEYLVFAVPPFPPLELTISVMIARTRNLGVYRKAHFGASLLGFDDPWMQYLPDDVYPPSNTGYGFGIEDVDSDFSSKIDAELEVWRPAAV